MREKDSAESYCEKGLYEIVEDCMHGVRGHPDPVGVPNVIFSNRRCRESICGRIFDNEKIALPMIINIDRSVILKRRRADKSAKKARRRNRNLKK